MRVRRSGPIQRHAAGLQRFVDVYNDAERRNIAAKLGLAQCNEADVESMSRLYELLERGVGDPRGNGSTPLIGAIMSNQPSIVQYLVDQGADVRVKTTLGWTPLDVANGVFCCNAKKEFPAAAAIIRKALGQ